MAAYGAADKLLLGRPEIPSGSRRAEGDEPRLVAAIGDEAKQIARRYGGRRRVHERMVVEGVMAQHLGIEDKGNAMRGIVHQRKGRDAAGMNGEGSEEQVGAAEGETGRAQPLGERLEVDPTILEHDDQPQPALAVFEEEALAMPARQGPAQNDGFGDRMERRMAMGDMADVERVEAAEEIVGRPRHGAAKVSAEAQAVNPVRALQSRGGFV